MTMEGIEPVESVEAPREAPTMTADQVRKVVQREKAEAIEKGRREAQAQYEQELAALKQQQGSMGGMAPQIDEEQLYGKFFDRLMGDVQKHQFEANMQNIAANYIQNMSKGRDLYEDFDKVTAAFEPEAFPKVVQLVSGMENAADIIYELSKNPSKLVTVNDLANRSPKMAQAQLQSLVDSIKMNQAAKENNVRTNPPLSKHQPSATAGADSGGMSIADYKRAKWLKA